jgi:regulator of replication initiation timing
MSVLLCPDFDPNIWSIDVDQFQKYIEDIIEENAYLKKRNVHLLKVISNLKNAYKRYHEKYTLSINGSRVSFKSKL